MLRAVRRRLPARVTNLTLLVALVLVFATGVGAVATGSPRGRWIVLGHGVAAALVVTLARAKTPIVRAGLRRRRPSRYASLLLAGLTVAALVAGVLHSTGLIRTIGGLPTLWFHIAVALALVPLLVWHLVTSRVRPRLTDASRRVLLRTAWLVGVAAVLDAGVTLATDAARLPGSRRRFTGSYETASFQPEGFPATIWLADAVPEVDPARWRLTVVDAAGRRNLPLAELTAAGVHRRALLDCTSGWYSVQDWDGVPVASLLRDRSGARSLLVHAVTGYWVRFPVEDVDQLLLATRVGGAPLTPAHGYPVRLVAPGRRGYWWVKWVDRIELSADPSWWQPPFPLT
jgi:DMSO/TMAO reductase YedYZ molybdopterin-dependent catalytic subunit